MKIVENLEQNTQEWLDFHSGKISGSKANEYSRPRNILKDELVAYAQSKGYEFPKSITIPSIRAMMTQEERDELDFTVQLNDSIYKLIAERIAKPINANDYTDAKVSKAELAMLRGHILEQEAVQKVVEKLKLDMSKIHTGRVWQADCSDSIICSPDAEIETDGKITQAIEIKCLDSWQVVKAFYENKPPVDYRYQILQYFVVNEDLETLYFAIYSDVMAAAPQLELQIFEIKRADIQAEIETARKVQEATLAIVEQEVAKLTF